MDGKGGEPPGPRQKDTSLPGHDIFCTPENSNFLSGTPYSALDPTQREIRLLKVLPDSGSGFVECELLPSAPIAEVRGKYLALSYCAGDPRNTEIILVNGVKCNVFANLCHALTCARHFWTTQPGDEDFLLWADQICINQADLSERSHQVGFMRDIYQSAQQTLICLSTSNTQGKGMKWFIKAFYGDGKRPRRQSRGKPTTNPGDNLTTFWEEVTESPWWTRAWVFQEFMVSAEATFLSGRYHLPWVMTQFALERYLGHEYDRTILHSLIGIMKPQNSTVHFRNPAEAVGIVRVMLKTKAEWDDAYSLPFLLARSQGFKASDDRDRIYAFLGLAHPGYAITPDYSASNTLCHVLTETTKNIILFEDHLNVLSALGTYRRSRRPGLPSWVVDWTRKEVPVDAGRNFNAVKSTPPHRDQAIVSFRETTFPKTFQAATVMEVTGIFATLIPDRNQHPVPRSGESDLIYGNGTTNLEVWYLGELPFALKSESYGYRIIRRVGAFVDGPEILNVPDKREALARATPRVISIF
ncbi:HET domain-containing protein [Fusarium falciforme]|uniref:HET domain-containing protein n=1 Tax=Fusarium falciforme TaxID=195108 RepID=UPI002301435B|nr:HET domain-containing protein [Fusarium falciforme]WAO93306.1 HET domain-containing protein [Fusarium falciforme]